MGRRKSDFLRERLIYWLMALVGAMCLLVSWQAMCANELSHKVVKVLTDADEAIQGVTERHHKDF